MHNVYAIQENIIYSRLNGWGTIFLTFSMVVGWCATLHHYLFSFFSSQCSMVYDGIFSFDTRIISQHLLNMNPFNYPINSQQWTKILRYYALQNRISKLNIEMFSHLIFHHQSLSFYPYSVVNISWFSRDFNVLWKWKQIIPESYSIYYAVSKLVCVQRIVLPSVFFIHIKFNHLMLLNIFTLINVEYNERFKWRELFERNKFHLLPKYGREQMLLVISSLFRFGRYRLLFKAQNLHFRQMNKF